jgi:beta-galactosidase
VENQGLSSSTVTVSAIVTDRDGKLIGKTTEQPVSLNINETKTIKQKVTVTSPKLWSLESPYLYRVTSFIKAKGKITDNQV